MIRKIYILIFAFALSTIVLAQDSHFSMYYAPSIELNPATTGQIESYFRAHLQYRDQWRSIMDKPFQTANFSFDKEFKRFGYGILIHDNKAGLTNMNTLKILVSGSYEITQDYKQVHHLSTGIQIGMVQKSLDPNVTYNNQYDKDYNGGNFNPLANSGENFVENVTLIPEFNYGIYYHKTDPKHWLNPRGGVSVNNLSQPKVNFYNIDDGKTSMRWTTFGGAKIKLKEFYHVEPMVYYSRLANAKEFSFGALFNYEPDNLTTGFFIGPYYRTFFNAGDAIQLHTGISLGEYVIRFSYDFTTSTLSKYNGGKGGFEVSITYVKHKGKYIPSIL